MQAIDQRNYLLEKILLLTLIRKSTKTIIVCKIVYKNHAGASVGFSPIL